MSKRFNAGDRVIVKPDLEVGLMYNGLYFSPLMNDSKGRAYNIGLVTQDRYYRLSLPDTTQLIDFYYNEDMLNHVANIPRKMKIINK